MPFLSCGDYMSQSFCNSSDVHLPIVPKLTEVPEIVFYCPNFMYQNAFACIRNSDLTMSRSSLFINYDHICCKQIWQFSLSQKCLDHIDEMVAAKMISWNASCVEKFMWI